MNVADAGVKFDFCQKYKIEKSVRHVGPVSAGSQKLRLNF